jgi:two-component system, sensor histidine kinase and response regulator
VLGCKRELRVLLAGQDGTDRILAAHMLKQAGAQVDVVADGREALAAIEREPYDLVLVDVDMPEIFAFKAATATRRRDGGSGATPVIGVAAPTDGARERWLSAGMMDCITKPLQTAALHAVLERWTERPKRAPIASVSTAGDAARPR